jgi:hypothetical protein
MQSIQQAGMQADNSKTKRRRANVLRSMESKPPVIKDKES